MNNTSKISVIVKDQTIIEEFYAGLAKSLDSEGKSEIHKLLNNYCNKVVNRDKTIQLYSSQIQEKHNETVSIKENLRKAKKEADRMKLELIRTKQQIQLLKEKEKNLQTKFSSKQKNVLMRYLIRLKQNLNLCDNFIYSKSKSLEILKIFSLETTNSIKKKEKILSTLKFSFREITEDLKAVQYQIEKILEKQQKNRSSLMLTSEDFEKSTISTLKFNIDEITTELESSTKELNDFENEFSITLQKIEQEESIIRNQQQLIESALRNVEIETKRIKDMETFLVKFDEADAAPIPETLKDINRSKSASKFRKSPGSEDFYTYELKDGDEASIVKGNSVLELVVKPFGKQNIVQNNKLIHNQPRVMNKKYYRFNLEDTTQSEKNFLDKIYPLLEGAEIYKKSHPKTGLKQAFNPLDGYHPESCGFVLRQFRLHKSLKKIDIRQPLKPGFESVISTDSLLAPILTPNTILILKIQNHLNNNELDCGKFNEKVRETTYVDVNSETFKQKCRECSYYCFSIGLAHGENIDLVAKGYQLFKQWVNGINALVKYKKYIPKLYSRIESYTSV